MCYVNQNESSRTQDNRIQKQPLLLYDFEININLYKCIKGMGIWYNVNDFYLLIRSMMALMKPKQSNNTKYV